MDAGEAAAPVISDFGTIEDIRKERVMDLVVFAQFVGCAGTGLFSDSSVRIRLQPSERLALQSSLLGAESGNFSLFCRRSATVDSTRAGKTEPQKQQQLDAAMYPMFATVQVAEAVESFDSQGQHGEEPADQ